MNRRFWIGVVVVFVAYAALGWLFHGYVLRPIYRSEPLQHLWRSPDAYLGLMPLFHLSNLIFAFFFMWIFVKGYEARGPLEGIRYGFYIWALKGLHESVAAYVILPVTAGLLLSWLWMSLVAMILCGLLAAHLQTLGRCRRTGWRTRPLKERSARKVELQDQPLVSVSGIEPQQR